MSAVSINWREAKGILCDDIGSHLAAYVSGIRTARVGSFMVLVIAGEHCRGKAGGGRSDARDQDPRPGSGLFLEGSRGQSWSQSQSQASEVGVYGAGPKKMEKGGSGGWQISPIRWVSMQAWEHGNMSSAASSLSRLSACLFISIYALPLPSNYKVSRVGR